MESRSRAGSLIDNTDFSMGGMPAAITVNDGIFEFSQRAHRSDRTSDACAVKTPLGSSRAGGLTIDASPRSSIISGADSGPEHMGQCRSTASLEA